MQVSQSTQNLFVTCKGQGMEPHIEFEKSLLQFGPILPHTGSDDVSVKVINPCSFPVEFYSLEFDKQYLDEEKVSPYTFAFFGRIVFSFFLNLIRLRLKERYILQISTTVFFPKSCLHAKRPICKDLRVFSKSYSIAS